MRLQTIVMGISYKCRTFSSLAKLYDLFLPKTLCHWIWDKGMIGWGMLYGLFPWELLIDGYPLHKFIVTDVKLLKLPLLYCWAYVLNSKAWPFFVCFDYFESTYSQVGSRFKRKRRCLAIWAEHYERGLWLVHKYLYWL